MACTVMGQCVYRVNLGLTGKVSGILIDCGAAGGPKLWLWFCLRPVLTLLGTVRLARTLPDEALRRAERVTGV